MGSYWLPLGDHDVENYKTKTSTQVHDTGVDRIIGFRNKEETNEVSDEFRKDRSIVFRNRKQINMIKVYYSGAGYEPEEAIEFNTIEEAEADLVDTYKYCEAMETQITDTSNDDK